MACSRAMGGGAACTVAQKEERVRVSGLFREFLDIGSSKLDASMAPRLIKEALKSGGADNATVQRMVSEFKEVAPTRWPAGVIDAGGFASWYMDIAWPALHAAAEQRAKQLPKPPRPEAKPLRFEAAADGGAAVGARGAASAHNPPIPTAVASGPDPAPREPLGWALGRSMHLEETRRLLGLCARFERAQGQRGELSVAQLAPLFTRALGPAHADDALLHDALIAAATPPVNGAPLPAWHHPRYNVAEGCAPERAVPIGAVVRAWFDIAWPRVGPAAR